MSYKYLEVLTRVVRQPRHPVNDAEKVDIEIRCARALPQDIVPPEIIDFSRGGCGIRWNCPMQKNEAVVLRIVDNHSGLALELPGSIRWSRNVDERIVEAGCQFDEEINYEQLGELFIAGFLGTGDASP